MSDEGQPTPVDLLVDRLATRIGQLTAENEWLRVQLQLQQQDQEPQVHPGLNGEMPYQEVPIA